MNDCKCEKYKNMLEDVINALDLSESAIEEHGPLGTPPAEIVGLAMAEKDLKIKALENHLIDITKTEEKQLACPRCGSDLIRFDSNREMQISEIRCIDCDMGFQAPVTEECIIRMWKCLTKEECADDGYEDEKRA